MPSARKTDPATSHDAAASVQDLNATRLHILRALNRPRTDPEILEAYRNMKTSPLASESGVRSRRSELVTLGYVKDSGLRKTLPSGRQAIVWKRA